eukprot:1185647-Prorocentrum_minimum.AAC.9
MDPSNRIRVLKYFTSHIDPSVDHKRGMPAYASGNTHSQHVTRRFARPIHPSCIVVRPNFLEYATGDGAGEIWAVVVFNEIAGENNATGEDGRAGGAGRATPPGGGDGNGKTFPSAPAAEAINLDYTIRMNFSVVPRTWRIVDTHHHEARYDYKMYFTSGFLSLQAAIDGYALSQGGPFRCTAVPSAKLINEQIHR